MPRPQTPALAADIIIELMDLEARPIVLIERKYPPAGWAIPGGFVDVGETVEQAAVREALEETSLQVSLVALLGCYSKPARDPRGHTVSVVYVAHASGVPVARDDARSVNVCPPDQPLQPLAFDHCKILQDYLRWRGGGRVGQLYLG